MRSNHKNLVKEVFLVKSDYSSVYKQRAYRLIQTWTVADPLANHQYCVAKL